MKALTLPCLVLALVAAPGCDRDSQERKDRLAVDGQQKQYAISQAVPVFEWSQERDMAIQLYRFRNQSLRTWTVWRSDTGVVEGHCESIGFPLPYDVSLTNPLATDRYTHGVIEQPEPNGLFSSKHTSATWVRSVVTHGGKTLEVPIYVEGKVTCYPYPVLVDYDKNRVTRADTEAPTIALEKGKN